MVHTKEGIILTVLWMGIQERKTWGLTKRSKYFFSTYGVQKERDVVRILAICAKLEEADRRKQEIFQVLKKGN